MRRVYVERAGVRVLVFVRVPRDEGIGHACYVLRACGWMLAVGSAQSHQTAVAVRSLLPVREQINSIIIICATNEHTRTRDRAMRKGLSIPQRPGTAATTAAAAVVDNECTQTRARVRVREREAPSKYLIADFHHIV